MEELRQLVDRLTRIRKVSPLPESPIDNKPKPETISTLRHPLEFYPGFDKYVQLWNKHATSEQRLNLQREIESSKSQLELSEDMLTTSVPDVSSKKLSKRKMRRLARKEMRTKEREAHGEQPITTNINLSPEEKLKLLDQEFAISLDPDTVKFHIVEKLRDNQTGINDLLSKYARERNLDLDTLLTVNYFVLALLPNYGKKFTVSRDEMWKKAQIQAKIQLAHSPLIRFQPTQASKHLPIQIISTTPIVTKRPGLSSAQPPARREHYIKQEQNPLLIDLITHPLKGFAPFIKYAAEWNKHVISEERKVNPSEADVNFLLSRRTNMEVAFYILEKVRGKQYLIDSIVILYLKTRSQTFDFDSCYLINRSIWSFMRNYDQYFKIDEQEIDKSARSDAVRQRRISIEQGTPKG